MDIWAPFKSSYRVVTRKEIVDGVALIGLPLALVALFFALKQYGDAREQSRELGNIETRIKASLTQLQIISEDAHHAVEAASTRHVADFPASMDDITRVVQDTCGELDIMADVAGYGHFSAPNKFLEYLHAIEDVSRTPLADLAKRHECASGTRWPGTWVQTRVIVYNHTTLEATLVNQFSQGMFSRLKTEPQGRLNAYFDMHPYLPRPRSYHEFIAILLQQNAGYEQELQRAGGGLRLEFANHEFPFFIWMRDRSEAAFVFNYRRAKEGTVAEIPFITRDRDLTRVFSDIFEAQWDESRER